MFNVYFYWQILDLGTLQNSNCLSLLNSIDEAIKKWELDSGNSSNLLRIVVSAFGSPHWQFNEKSLADFTTTLLVLKSLVRSANVVAVVTIPHQFMNVSAFCY